LTAIAANFFEQSCEDGFQHDSFDLSPMKKESFDY